MPRKQKILLGLLMVLALALVYRLTNPYEQDTVERLTYARATKVTPPKSTEDAAAVVRLNLLQSPPTGKVNVQRDLFRPPQAAAPSQKSAPKPQAAVPEPPPKTERQKIQDHFRSFKTFGSYRHGKDVYLFLERGKQVLIVTRGDRIDGKYEITDLNEKSITITAKGLTKPLEIDFEEL